MMIGDTIRAARHYAGLTAQRLADEAGFHVQSIREWETGRVEPRLASYTRVRAALERHGVRITDDGWVGPADRDR